MLCWPVVGMVRLYVQPLSYMPQSNIPVDFKPVVDCQDEQEADELRAVLRHQGYEVLSVPI